VRDRHLSISTNPGTTSAACGMAFAACSNTSGDPAPTNAGSPSQQPTSTAMSTRPATPEEAAKTAAMAVYEGFWTTQNAAKIAPGSKDWTADISQYAADPARTSALDSIKNYASIPAHFEGEPRRSPSVASVSLAQPPRVVVADCLDVTGVKIVHDKTGENVGDTARQPPRYSFRAEVVLYANLNPAKWLVQITQPMLEQPC
jgi:hypothetical protein